MIHGIGTDICRVARFEGMLARHGERTAQRILAESELAGFARAPHPARFLARRFAAKEALAKAMGTGLRAPATLDAIAVTHDALGKPAFACAPALAQWLAERQLSAHLSISDEAEYAVAFVVLERTTP